MSSSNRSSTMSIFSFTFALLRLILLFDTVAGTDVKQVCPLKTRSWRPGCEPGVSCTLDTTNFTAAVCQLSWANYVDFLFTKNGSSTQSKECTVDLATSCGPTFNDKICACVSQDGNKYTFTYKLGIDVLKYKDGFFTCEPRCLDSNLRNLPRAETGFCSFFKPNEWYLETAGIVLLCCGTALVIAGKIIMILIAGSGSILGKVGIAAVACIGFILRIIGCAQLTIQYHVEDPSVLEQFGIALIWIGSVLDIPGIIIAIIGVFKWNVLRVLTKVGIGLVCGGCALLAIAGMVVVTEKCPASDDGLSTQEQPGIALACIGFFVFIFGIIILIVGCAKQVCSGEEASCNGVAGVGEKKGNRKH